MLVSLYTCVPAPQYARKFHPPSSSPVTLRRYRCGCGCEYECDEFQSPDENVECTGVLRGVIFDFYFDFGFR